MPGQSVWTLTEMLECNPSLCSARGGDCNVGPAQFLAAHFLLSPLGLQHTDLFKKNLRSRQRVFFLESSFFFFFLQQKRGSLVLVLCVCSCAKEKLQQRVCRKIAAAGFYTT